MLRSRRFALVATAVIIGLSACSGGGDTTSVGKNPAVIVLGAGSGNRAASPSVEGAADDKMMAPMYMTYEWVGGAYPDLGTAGPSWSLPAGTSVDEAVIAKIAQALGVTGEVRTLPAEQGGGWMVGPADYSGPSVTVSKDGLLSWWYSGPMAGVRSTSAGCAVPGDTTGGGTDASSGSGAAPIATDGTAVTDPAAPPDTAVAVEPCVIEEPTPPANVPDKAAAEAATKDFLASIGLDASQYSFTTYADQWSASTTAWLQLGGHRSPIQVNLGFGENGTIQWASGSLAVPQAGAEYPIVSPAEALTRLQDQSGKWFGYWGGGVGIARDAVAGVGVNDAATDAVSPALGAPEVAPMPPDTVCDPAADCVIDPMPTPEPVVVSLNAVRLDLTMVWAADGTVWLLPAYTFTSADGGEYTVIAVEDQYVQTPDPITTDPGTVTSDPGSLGTIPPDSVVSPPVSEPVPSLPDAVDIDAATKLLTGLGVDEATKVAESNGWTLRVSTLDGEAQMLTEDYSPSRVNVSVTGGVVTAVDFIG